MAEIVLGPISWERMIRAVEKVRDRLRRAAQALENAGVPYAVIGGNAVAVWVSRVDERAVRNTPGVDLLLNRADLQRATVAFRAAGFIPGINCGRHQFLDSQSERPLGTVQVFWAAEKFRPEHCSPTPEVTESEQDKECRILPLEALVRMKLTSFRDKDRTHLRDLLDVGLLDASWPARLPAELGARLQTLLDTPHG
jgi:hypothetical protein